VLVAIALLALGVGSVEAFPTPPTPLPRPSPSFTPVPPSSDRLPIGSRLTFVLDDQLSSSSSRAGEIVRAHLKDPIVLQNRTVVPAGTPEKIKVVDASASQIGDVYGFVDIFFEPMQLANGTSLPLSAPVSRLSPRDTAGHESTVQIEDTVGSEVIPGYVLFAIFRKGKNFVLKPGSQVPADTEATVIAQSGGTVTVQTPQPLEETLNAPKGAFPVEPVATPIGGNVRMPSHGKPSPLPTPTGPPTPTPTPSASPIPTPAASSTPMP
jgi:hypothetical protein